MHKNKPHGEIFRLIGVVIIITSVNASCKETLYACKTMVKPFLYDLRYMFPTAIQDVDDMCKLWSRFVDCVRKYMNDCTNKLVKSKFNAAVSDTVRTVHAICSSNKYQQGSQTHSFVHSFTVDYLDHAVCFKRVAAANCGLYYRRMVEQVANSRADKHHICCTFSHFQQCVNDPLLRQCGRRVHGLMTHSMAYLVSHCGNTYYPLNFKCPSAAPEIPPSRISTNQITSSKFLATTVTSRPTWFPRTVIYTLPPTQGSRTSFGESVRPASLLFVTFMSYVSYILRGR